jgi:HEPN domain
MIKAVLAHNDVSYERTHNITYLLTLLDSAQISRPAHADNLPDLTPWAAGFRYADLPEPALHRQETWLWSNRPGTGLPSNLEIPKSYA